MKETISFISEALHEQYPPEEINTFTRWILEEVCNLTLQQQILCKDIQLSHAKKEHIQMIVQRLRKMEPLQYILEKCYFYGLIFNVNPSVLIPRPETEELVNHIIGSETKSNLKILDIGTGSGCIAVTLAKHLVNPEVYAIDISAEALVTANKNAKQNNTIVHFQHIDILSDNVLENYAGQSFNIIVSNPPYVKNSEKATMLDNVLHHEPHQALFVPDHDPLLFYRRIADIGLLMLKKSGRLYFEINAACGAIITDMLNEKGYQNIQLIQDLEGKDRFVKATKRNMEK